MSTQLVEAILQSGVTYDDLIDDIMGYLSCVEGNSYFHSEAYVRTEYPTISEELISTAASMWDECPLCRARSVYVARFLHADGCVLYVAPGQGGDD